MLLATISWLGLAGSWGCGAEPNAGAGGSSTSVSTSGASADDSGSGMPESDASTSIANASSGGPDDSVTSDTTHGDDGSSSSTGLEPATDFISIYIAGEGNVGPVGIPDEVVLEASPFQLDVLSNGDFVVFGEEQFQTNGVGEISTADAVYRFSGVDGTLVWKQLQHTPTNLLRLLGVGSDDAVYVALGSTDSFSIRRYEPDGEIGLRSPDSGDALEAELDALADPFASSHLSGSVVTADDLVVAGITLDASVLVFAVFDATTELQYVASRPMAQYPVGLRERAPGELVAAATDVSNDDGMQGSRIELLTLQLESGDLSAVSVDTSSYEVGPGEPTEYASSWSPIDLQPVAGGDDVWLLAREHYFDAGNSRVHIFRVATDGTVLAHALAEPTGLTGEVGVLLVRSLTVTPEGPMVVGYYTDVVAPGAYDPYALALRYDDALNLLEDYQLPELDGYVVEWESAATRDGRSIMVGAIEHVAIVSHGTEFGAS